MAVNLVDQKSKVEKNMREPEKVEALFIELIRSPQRMFPPLRGQLDAPDRQGVYVIYDPRGKVVHVGRTPRAAGGIAQRLRNHMNASSSFTKKYLKGGGSRLRGKFKFRCIVVRNRRQRALLEAYAIGRLCPAHIGLG